MNKQQNISYSVLMSVYYKDNPQWLRESIESILNQTIKTNDFVIVKDGELSNELEDVISEYLKKYSDIFNVITLKQNQGLGPALAIGVKSCKNNLIARMDSDDISDITRIEKQLKMFDIDDYDIVGSNIIEFIDNVDNIQAYRKLPENSEEIKEYAKRRNPFGHPSVILNKKLVLKAGNFRNYYLCEDYDMWIRMIENGAKCYNVQENLVYMRVNENFYKRRGGIKYLKSIIKFKKEQLDKGFFSYRDYIISSSATILVCLLPNSLREIFYKKILRKKR